MRIELVLVGHATDGCTTTVSTTVAVDTADPRWTLQLVDTVVGQAAEGARRLVEQVADGATAPPHRSAAEGFVPLAHALGAARAACAPASATR
jgi:hypothetical protein